MARVEKFRLRGLRKLAKSEAPVAPLPVRAPDTSGLQVSPPVTSPDYPAYVEKYNQYQAAQTQYTHYRETIAPAIGTTIKPNPQTPEGKVMATVIQTDRRANQEAATGAATVTVAGVATTAFIVGESLTLGLTAGLAGTVAAGGVLLVDAARRKIRVRQQVREAGSLTALAESHAVAEKRKTEREHLLRTRYVFSDVTTKDGTSDAKLFGYEPVAKITRPWMVVGRNVRVWPYRKVDGKISRDSKGDPIRETTKPHAHAEFSWGWPTPSARRRAVELAVRGTPGLRSGLPIVDRAREVGEEKLKTDLVLRTKKGSRKVELVDKGEVVATTTVYLARKDSTDRKLRVAAKRVRLRRSGEYTMWRLTGKGLVTPWRVYGRAA